MFDKIVVFHQQLRISQNYFLFNPHKNYVEKDFFVSLTHAKTNFSYSFDIAANPNHRVANFKAVSEFRRNLLQSGNLSFYFKYFSLSFWLDSVFRRRCFLCFNRNFNDPLVDQKFSSYSHKTAPIFFGHSRHDFGGVFYVPHALGI